MENFLKILIVCLLYNISCLHFGYAQIKELNHNNQGLLRSLSQEEIKIKKRLSPSQIDSLFSAMMSTRTTAGLSAIKLLTDLTNDANNLADAAITIVSGLTTQCVHRSNTSPLDNATLAVKTILAVTPIASDHGQTSLLHYAAFFDLLGPILDSTSHTTTSVKTLATALLAPLTATQQLAALTQQDEWLTTPLHYAALSQDPTTTLITTMFSEITQPRYIASALATKNIWGHTPVHYAAQSKNTKTIAALLHNTSPAQKLTAITTKDQAGTTPLHYGALSNNTTLINDVFLPSLNSKQLFEALSAKNMWESNVMHYASQSDNPLIIEACLAKLPHNQKIELITAKNSWGHSSLDLGLYRQSSNKKPNVLDSFLTTLMPSALDELTKKSLPKILGRTA